MYAVCEVGLVEQHEIYNFEKNMYTICLGILPRHRFLAIFHTSTSQRVDAYELAPSGGHHI